MKGYSTSGVEPDETYGKWAGIGKLGNTVYAAPRAGGAKSVLVFDTGSRRASGIPVGHLEGRAGWWGFVAGGGKLYAPPAGGDSVPGAARKAGTAGV